MLSTIVEGNLQGVSANTGAECIEHYTKPRMVVVKIVLFQGSKFSIFL